MKVNSWSKLVREIGRFMRRAAEGNAIGPQQHFSRNGFPRGIRIPYRISVLVCRLHQEEEREKETQPAGYIGQCTCSLTGLMIDVGRAVLAFLFSFFCTEEGMLEQSNQASSFCGCLRRKTSENLFYLPMSLFFAPLFFCSCRSRNSRRRDKDTK